MSNFTIADFVTALGSLFTFLTSSLFSIGDALVQSVIGQIIIGVAIFSLLVYTIAYFTHK